MIGLRLGGWLRVRPKDMLEFRRTYFLWYYIGDSILFYSLSEGIYIFNRIFFLGVCPCAREGTLVVFWVLPKLRTNLGHGFHG